MNVFEANAIELEKLRERSPYMERTLSWRRTTTNEGHAPARCSMTRYLTSIVVTLRAGNVIFSDVPLAACVPMRTGCTGVCPWAEVAVI
jgi:hypothetical protein